MSHFKGPEVPRFKSSTSVLKLLLTALRSHGSDTALIEGFTGLTVSYADILQQGKSVAAGLCSKGVNPSDVVVLCCEKSILAFSLLLGALFTGATVALVPTKNAAIINHMTKGHHVKVIFCDADLLGDVLISVESLCSKPSLVATTELNDPATLLLLNNSEEFSVFDVRDAEKHVCIIMYSSGTTGIPKGVEVTDSALQLAGSGTDTLKSFLATSPLYWVSGFFMWLGALLRKRQLVLSNSTEARENLQLAEKYKVEGLFIGTGAMARYTYEQSRQPVDLSSVKRVFAGGETILEFATKKFVDKVLEFRLKVETVYGSSETGTLTFNSDYQLMDGNRVVSSGKVLPGCEIKIVGKEGWTVPIGCLGELRIKSRNMTTGYWNRPELNDELFDEEGFFSIGDIGHFDVEGNLYVLGRVADIITYRGIQIPSTVLEDLLTSHPGVLEAAVVGRPHSQDTHHVTAFVVKKPHSDVTEAQIQAFVDGKVEDHMKLRGGVHFLDALPRAPTGKVLRKQLREMAE